MRRKQLALAVVVATLAVAAAVNRGQKQQSAAEADGAKSGEGGIVQQPLKT